MLVTNYSNKAEHYHDRGGQSQPGIVITNIAVEKSACSRTGEEYPQGGSQSCYPQAVPMQSRTLPLQGPDKPEQEQREEIANKEQDTKSAVRTRMQMPSYHRRQFIGP
ncbi:MAG TPA: hypothetical protein VGU68_17800 [Ktedonobacteraceae bacterium]|nr:hypothetical protein [Ktedonobacteraceae bacterium]